MGKTKRQGRHARLKPWERERRRRPDRAGREQSTPDETTPRRAAERETAARNTAERPAAERPAAKHLAAEHLAAEQTAAAQNIAEQTATSRQVTSPGVTSPGAKGHAAAAGEATAQAAAFERGIARPGSMAPAGRRVTEPAGYFVPAPARPAASESYPRQPPYLNAPAAGERPAGQDGHGISAAARAEQLVSDALAAQFDGDRDTFGRCAAGLAQRPGPPGWPRAADRELLVSLVRAVTDGWRQGWQPVEVVREIGRQFGARHARMATDIAAMEMRNYAYAAVDEQWQAQLTALGAAAWWDTDENYLQCWCEREHLPVADAVTCALEVLFGLAALPRLGRLCPLPGTARPAARPPERYPARPGGQRTLNRARTLLAQAEATELPEKAEALTSRAQELLASRSLGDALAEGRTDPSARDTSGRRVFVDSPYESAKAVLLDVVATANRCRAVWHKDLGLSTVLGFPDDLDAVELIFTSLQVQAATAMVHAAYRRDESDGARTRSFRQSFLASYARHIGERLDEANRAAQQQAAGDPGGPGLPPVLAARDRVVDEALGRMFPELSQHHAA